MKNFKYIFMVGALISSISAYSAKGVDDGSRFGTGEDSIRCIENLSLYGSYYKIKDYESAYNSWKIVYDECPQAGGRTLYSQGAFLIATKMSKEKDAVKKLITMYPGMIKEAKHRGTSFAIQLNL